MRNLAASLKEAGWAISMLPSTASPTWLQPRGVIIQFASSKTADEESENVPKIASHVLAEYLNSIGIGAHTMGFPYIQQNVTIAIIINEK